MDFHTPCGHIPTLFPPLSNYPTCGDYGLDVRKVLEELARMTVAAQVFLIASEAWRSKGDLPVIFRDALRARDGTLKYRLIRRGGDWRTTARER